MHDFNVGDKVWDRAKGRKGIVRQLDEDVKASGREAGSKHMNRHWVDWLVEGVEDEDGDWMSHEDRDLVPYSNASSPDEVAIDEAGGSEKPVSSKFNVGDEVYIDSVRLGIFKERGTVVELGVLSSHNYQVHLDKAVHWFSEGELYHTNPSRSVSSTGAAKELKPARHSLIPTAALNLLAEHYGKGATKYGDTPDEPNWRKGYNWSQSYDALQRHATAFWGGEDLDPETELPHMSAVVFHAFSLLTFMQEHPEFDDRYKG